MRGEYILVNEDGSETVIANSLIEEGLEQLITTLFNYDDITGHNFIFGAFAEVPVYGATLQAQYTTEPTIGVGAYARQSVNPTGWAIVAANNEVYAESPLISFTATGADFDKSFNRLFMAVRIENPAATFVEYLTSVGSALAAMETVLDGQTFSIKYRLFFK